MVGQTFRRQKGPHVYESSWYRCGFATTSPMIQTLTQLVNTHIEAAFREQSRGVEHVKAEILRLEREAGNLVRFLAEGGESATVRSELQGIEGALQGLRLELAGREAMPSVPPQVHPTWMGAKLDQLLRQTPAQAKAEIAKHLDGELMVRPLPSTGHGRRAEIRRAGEAEQPPGGPGGCLR